MTYWKPDGTSVPEIMSLLNNNFEEFKTRFWDARVFGNTFLEEGGGDTIRTGVAQFALGISVAPIRIERLTNTKMAPAQGAREGGEAPTRGMAPLGYRMVEHGVYSCRSLLTLLPPRRVAVPARILNCC